MSPLLALWVGFVLIAGFAAAVLWSGLPRPGMMAVALGPLLGAVLGAGGAIWWLQDRLAADLHLRPPIQIIPSAATLSVAAARGADGVAAVDRWLDDVEAKTRRLTRAGVLVLDESLLPQAARDELPAAWWLPTLDVGALVPPRSAGGSDGERPGVVLRPALPADPRLDPAP